MTERLRETTREQEITREREIRFWNKTARFVKHSSAAQKNGMTVRTLASLTHCCCCVRIHTP